MLDTSGRGPFTNSHQLGWVCVDLAMANYVAQVIDLTLKKCIFLYLHTELVSAKAGSGWNRGGLSASRGYNYTQGYCQGT